MTATSVGDGGGGVLAVVVGGGCVVVVTCGGGVVVGGIVVGGMVVVCVVVGGGVVVVTCVVVVGGGVVVVWVVVGGGAVVVCVGVVVVGGGDGWHAPCPPVAPITVVPCPMSAVIVGGAVPVIRSTCQMQWGTLTVSVCGPASNVCVELSKSVCGNNCCSVPSIW
jgi:hypothetical protein